MTINKALRRFSKLEVKKRVLENEFMKWLEAIKSNEKLRFALNTKM